MSQEIVQKLQELNILIAEIQHLMVSEIVTNPTPVFMNTPPLGMAATQPYQLAGGGLVSGGGPLAQLADLQQRCLTLWHGYKSCQSGAVPIAIQETSRGWIRTSPWDELTMLYPILLNEFPAKPGESIVTFTLADRFPVEPGFETTRSVTIRSKMEADLWYDKMRRDPVFENVTITVKH